MQLKTKNRTLILLLGFGATAAAQNPTEEAIKQTTAEQIVKECLEKHHPYSTDWQQCLDAGLAKDSTLAYLWQQKAMPLFKQRKYELGMRYIDKAVTYDARQWQPYRAFIKCIFAKTYTEAIRDFEDCIAKFGNDYRMDHTYRFYIGLCQLQLNNFETAETIFKQYIDELYQKRNKLEHPTAWFYYGIALYEQKKYDQATAALNNALKEHPNFSDAQYYQSLILWKQGKEDQARDLFNLASTNGKAGHTLIEDNVIYETYPYQIIWKRD